MQHPMLLLIGIAFASIVTAFGGDEGLDSKQSQSASIEDKIALLDRLKPGTETDDFITALAREGDKAVAEIENQMPKYGKTYIGWGHRAVLVLKAVNSERSRSLLHRIAMGEFKFGNEGWAAGALIEIDKSEAWALLASTNSAVLPQVLKIIDGQPIDEKYLASLKKGLANKDPFVRWRITEILVNEPTGKYFNEAIAAIGKTLSEVENMPDFNKPRPGTGLTMGESYYSYFFNMFSKQRLDLQVIQNIAKPLKGRARDVLLITLARRGDTSVHDEMIRIAKDPQAEMFRVWAVRTLLLIGTPDDLPLLRSLAESDPLVRSERLRPPNPTDSMGPTYPVRNAAKAAIILLDPHESEKSDK
jgi:hypothetical protein